MGDDDLGDAFLERTVDHRERVVPGEVSGRQDQIVPRDRAEHVAGLRQEATVGRRHVHRLDAETELAQLVLEAGPLRHLVARLRLRTARRLRRGVDGRHPHDARALAGRDLDRERVHPADCPVERQRPDDLDAGDGRDDLRALGGRGVVRLECEPGEPELDEAARERDVVDPPSAARPGRRGRAGRTRRARACAPARSVALIRLPASPSLRPYRSSSSRARRAAPRSRSRSAARPRARAGGRGPPPSRRPAAAACVRLPSSSALEERLADHRFDLPLEPLRAPLASRRLHALDDRRRRAPS